MLTAHKHQPLPTDPAELNRLMAVLSDRQRAVIEMRFGLEGKRGHTLEEVATILGTTRERVRQIEMQALRQTGLMEKAEVRTRTVLRGDARISRLLKDLSEVSLERIAEQIRTTERTIEKATKRLAKLNTLHRLYLTAKGDNQPEGKSHANPD
jgi:DNA-binding CsgD family transcriptional regulator